MHKVFPLLLTEVWRRGQVLLTQALPPFQHVKRRFLSRNKNMKKYSLRLYLFNLGKKVC